MKVLVVHNRYQSASPSGENAVVDNEVGLLRSAGVEVATFFRSVDDLEELGSVARATEAVRGTFGHGASRSSFKFELTAFRPDVVHLHNSYPLISPHVIRWAHEAGVPVVATVHNFRLRCLNGQFFRDGLICTKCEDSAKPWTGVLHRCYRGSFAQSAVMAAAQSQHRGHWGAVDRYLAVSQFVATRLLDWGIPEDRVVVKPNFVADPGQSVGSGEGFVFVGRLSSEKGITLLMDAWEASGLDRVSAIHIAGDGPLRAVVEEWCGRSAARHFHGQLSGGDVRRLRAATSVAVVPSLWFEAQPLSVVESFAAGRPVVVAAVGALPELVPDAVGWSAVPTPVDLANALREAHEPIGRGQRAVSARALYEARFSPQVAYDALISEYQKVIVR